jgi:hypothetical protein
LSSPNMAAAAGAAAAAAPLSSQVRTWRHLLFPFSSPPSPHMPPVAPPPISPPNTAAGY